MSAEGRRDPAVLRALLDRVEKAKGPDRDLHLEGDLLRAIFGTKLQFWPKQYIGLSQAPTISIDACVTILRHALPQSFWSVCDMENGPAAVIIRPMPNGYIGGGMYAEAATPPLAFLAALLKSLIANAEEGR